MYYERVLNLINREYPLLINLEIRTTTYRSGLVIRSLKVCIAYLSEIRSCGAKMVRDEYPALLN